MQIVDILVTSIYVCQRENRYAFDLFGIQADL